MKSMKTLLSAVIIILIFFTACDKNTSVLSESESENSEEPVIVSSEIAETTPPIRTTPPATTTSTTAKTEPPEPLPIIMSEKIAASLVKKAIDPNDELDIELDFDMQRSDEIDGVDYFYGYIRGSAYAKTYYVSKVTGEVFLRVNGKLMALPIDEMSRFLIFIEVFNSMPQFTSIPAFNDINEIPLSHILKLYENNYDIGYDYIVGHDFEYEEQIEKFPDGVIVHNKAYGVYPKTIEEVIKKRYNPEFKIEHYDFNSIMDNSGSVFYADEYGGLYLSYQYKVVWDEENKAFAFIPIYSAGGGHGAGCITLKTYKENDTYYAVTFDYWSTIQYFEIKGYYLSTVKKNENDEFIIISKTPIDINTISFTDEEIADFRWKDEFMFDNKFFMPGVETKKIIENFMSNIVSDEELYYDMDFNEYWFRKEVYGEPYINCYLAYIRYDDADGKTQTIGKYYVDMVTGEVYPYDE